MRSDVLNCQFSMMDLMAHSFTHKAALWGLYGKADMAALSSQLLLHLDTSESQALNCYSGEATCQAICNMAIRLTDLVNSFLFLFYSYLYFLLDANMQRQIISTATSHSQQLIRLTICIFSSPLSLNDKYSSV